MKTLDPSKKRVFICGSALKGQPDHKNLQDATFIKAMRTKPIYRIHSAEDGWHPAIYQVEDNGVSIPGEIYELTLHQYEHLVKTEPPNMYPSDIVLDDGDVVTAIFYPKELVEKHNWPDISHYGGWAAYKEAIAQQK